MGISCPKCKKEISWKEKICKYCGYQNDFTNKKNNSNIRWGETSIYIAIYGIIGLLIIFIFNSLTPKSDCIRQAKKRLRNLESVKVIKSDIKSGTGNLTLSYKNRFGFKEQTTYKCFRGELNPLSF